MEEIESNGIKIYPLPDCDSDEDEDYKEQVYQMTHTFYSGLQIIVSLCAYLPYPFLVILILEFVNFNG